MFPPNCPYGAPLATAQFKQQLEDFQVEEQLDFPLADTGEHHYLLIEKQGINTEYLAKRLAQCVELPPSAIGYAGRKDRQGVTQQWFSLHAHQSIDWADRIERLNRQLMDDSDGVEQIRLLQATLHTHKLRVGQVAENRFTIRLRAVKAVSGEQNMIEQAIQQRLEEIQTVGFANYFGPQRFPQLERLLEENDLPADSPYTQHNRHQLDTLLSQHYRSRLNPKRRGRKGFELSMLRSLLYNLSLYDLLNRGDTDLQGLSMQQEIEAPLYGEVRSREVRSRGDRVHYWSQTPFAATLAQFPKLTELIEQQRVEVGWRAVSVKPVDLTVDWIDAMAINVKSDDSLAKAQADPGPLNHREVIIKVKLPSGSYASTLLSHFFQLQ